MRPVNKPNPLQLPAGGQNVVNAYTYYTDASLNTPINFAIVGNKGVRGLLRVLLLRARRQNPNIWGLQWNTIENRLTARDANPPGYRSANPQLDARLGPFCSFCEIYKPGHEIAVEHRLPKSQYPFAYVWWGNFLQACSRCNSIKSDHPLRGISAGFIQAPARATAYLNNPIPPLPNPPPLYRTNEQPNMQKALERHFWPDLDPRSFQRVKYEMQNAGNAHAAIRSDWAAIRMNNNVNFFNYAVTANLRLNGAGQQVVPNVDAEIVALRRVAEAAAATALAAAAANVAAAAAVNVATAIAAAGKAASNTSPAIGIAINANAVGANAAAVAASVNNPLVNAAANAAHTVETNRTLQLTGLDRLNTARAGYRTEAWFTILGLIKVWEDSLAVLPLAQQIPAVQSAMFNVFWSGLLITAKGKGFYSTLIELLLQIPLPAYVAPPPLVAQPGGGWTLAHKFIHDSNQANNNNQLQTIPGTNVNHIP